MLLASGVRKDAENGAACDSLRRRDECFTYNRLGNDKMMNNAIKPCLSIMKRSGAGKNCCKLAISSHREGLKILISTIVIAIDAWGNTWEERICDGSSTNVLRPIRDVTVPDFRSFRVPPTAIYCATQSLVSEEVFAQMVIAAARMKAIVLRCQVLDDACNVDNDLTFHQVRPAFSKGDYRRTYDNCFKESVNYNAL